MHSLGRWSFFEAYLSSSPQQPGAPLSASSTQLVSLGFITIPHPFACPRAKLSDADAAGPTCCLAGFARYSFVATQQKDLESHSSSIYSQGHLADPVIRLEDFVNGESVRNQDIVAWVSAGLYHVPSAEDAPVTPTTGNLIGFSLIPFNYGDENQATDMADMIQVEEATESTLISKAASQCTPNFDDVPFLMSGFEEV